MITNYIYGLGGREISLDDLRSIFAEQQEVAKAGKAKEVIKYFGVRE